MSGKYYERVAAASGVDVALVKKVLMAAAYTPSDSDRPKLPNIQVKKCPCEGKACQDHHLSIGSFMQGSGFDKATAEEICRRVNNHYPLVGALREYVLLGRGKCTISGAHAEMGRIALASAGEM